MGRDLLFTLATPGGILFRGSVNRVTLRGVSGSFSVLAGHAPLVSSLPGQEAEWEDASGVHPFSLSGALVEVSPESLTLLAASAALT